MNVPKNINIVGKSAGESLSNKFVSIIFCTTKGDPAWTQSLTETVAKVALSRNDAKKASLHVSVILNCVHLYNIIFFIIFPVIICGSPCSRFISPAVTRFDSFRLMKTFWFSNFPYNE